MHCFLLIAAGGRSWSRRRSWRSSYTASCCPRCRNISTVRGVSHPLVSFRFLSRLFQPPTSTERRMQVLEWGNTCPSPSTKKMLLLKKKICLTPHQSPAVHTTDGFRVRFGEKAKLMQLNASDWLFAPVFQFGCSRGNTYWPRTRKYTETGSPLSEHIPHSRSRRIR